MWWSWRVALAAQAVPWWTARAENYTQDFTWQEAKLDNRRFFAFRHQISPYAQRMTYRPIAICGGFFCAILLSGCGNDDDMPILAGNTEQAITQGEAIYGQAKSADDAGKSARAIKLYDEVATKYPFAPNAAQARFRQAELLERQGEVEDSFDAYQKFITRFNGSGLYSTALSRQAAMAQGAAEGDVKSGFLGMRTRYSLDKTVEMLGAVRDNAPQSATAAKAQFTIAELYHSKKKPGDAIEAYRQLVRDQPQAPQAPEALYQVGMLLMQQADDGNQNQANLDRAREAFQDYLLQYPVHKRNAEARKWISTLSGRDLQRSYDIAQFYQKTGKAESAKVYYRDIIKRAPQSQTARDARARLKELGE